jgi:hypothetical protein
MLPQVEFQGVSQPRAIQIWIGVARKITERWFQVAQGHIRLRITQQPEQCGCRQIFSLT